MSHDETTLLSVPSAPYPLTLSSRAEGDLDPVPVKGLALLATSGLENLP